MPIVCPLANASIYYWVDSTPDPRRYCPTQYDRGFVYPPNAISGNKPVTIGHQYSIVSFLPEKTQTPCPPWAVPLSCQRINTNEKSAVVGMKQINQCIQSQAAFKDTLCVTVADSLYSQLSCIKLASQNTNQVHISRVRSNRVLYLPAKEDTAVKRGRKKCYGKPFKLSDESTWKPIDEEETLTVMNKKGKE